jgi:hypothetical protein
MKTILIARADGGVSLMTITDDVTDVEAEVEKWKTGIKPGEEYVGHSEIDSVPEDRYFRNAWTYIGGRIEIDMPKAREVHKAKLRVDRAPLLTALDVEYQRADEDGDGKAKAGVAARKKALRDITNHPGIDAARTPEELKKIGLPESIG